MSASQPPRDGGFSLIELTVVMLILSVIIVIGIASYLKMTEIADDRGTKLDLVTATKVQELNHVAVGLFTDDVGELSALEPMLGYSADGDPAGTVVVEIEAGRADTDVCLFSKTAHGDWFSIYHSVVGGDRYADSAPVACTPGNVGGWSADPWQ